MKERQRSVPAMSVWLAVLALTRWCALEVSASLAAATISNTPVRLSPRASRADLARGRRLRGAPRGTLASAALGLGRHGAVGGDDAASKERLYEAYNKLHTLARAYRKPFDAPAVIVIGAQSSGKSALVEALMGFQFNEVGGGTRTRRPIALRMHYNADCDEPRCFICDDDGETEATLAQVRSYVEAENRRLERDAHRSFEAKEIVIRVEYRHCPNLARGSARYRSENERALLDDEVLIDTPGLIEGVNPVGGSESDGASSPRQRAVRRAAREAYELVLAKCKQREYILLCVDDTNDWKLGSIARELCMAADPSLSRTVVVNTKLDTKLLQFSAARDVLFFLKATILRELHPKLLAGPFFTTVPCGRVGRPSAAAGRAATKPVAPDRGNGDDAYEAYYDYDSLDAEEPVRGAEAAAWDDEADESFGDVAYGGDDEFRAATVRASSADTSLIRSRLGGDASAALGHRLGVAALRGFLEQHVERAYRSNVARVVPLLRQERATATKALQETVAEIEQLSPQRLRRSAQTLADQFCKALSCAVAGTVSAPPDVFGETLEAERLNGGAFLAPAAPVEDEADDDVEEEDDEGESLLGRLSGRRRRMRGGGAPATAFIHTRRPAGGLEGGLPDVSEETPAMELTLSQAALDSNVGHASASLYGGAQYRRALREFALAVRHLSLPTIRASEIANALGVGDAHDGADLVRAACVIAVDKARRSFEPQLETLALRVTHVMRRLPPVLDHILCVQQADSLAALPSAKGEKDQRTNPNARSMALVTSIYERYVTDLADAAVKRCRDDLAAMTRFVTWDLASANADAAVRSALKPSPALERVYDDDGTKVDVEKRVLSEWRSAANVDDDDDGDAAASSDSLVVALMSASAESEDAKARVVGALVRRIAAAWREHFARTVAVKFNCYFLMPFVNDFPFELRERVDDVCERGDDEFFDVARARRALEDRRDSLGRELEANTRLYETFDSIQRACAGAPAEPDGAPDWDAAERAASRKGAERP